MSSAFISALVSSGAGASGSAGQAFPSAIAMVSWEDTGGGAVGMVVLLAVTVGGARGFAGPPVLCLESWVSYSRWGGLVVTYRWVDRQSLDRQRFCLSSHRGGQPHQPF